FTNPYIDTTQPTRTFDRYWILTVTGDNFHIGADVWQIWLDNRIVGPARQKRPHELNTVIVDRAWLLEGATIGVSYGLHSSPSATISEKLHLLTPPSGD